MSKRVALLIGTSRGANSNGVAVAHYVASRWAKTGSAVELSVVEPVAHFNLPPLTGALIPAGSDMQYEDKAIASWSSFIRASAGLLIVSPQWNWSIPDVLSESCNIELSLMTHRPSLKLALDVLFPEWKDKPVSLVTYGGRGGSKLAEHLKVILPGGYKMNLLPSNVMVTLPKEFISGTRRIQKEEAYNVFQQYNDEVDALIKEIQDAVA